MATPLLLAVGFAVDQSIWVKDSSRMQATVDAAALAGAKALSGGATAASAQQVVQAFIQERNLANATASVTIDQAHDVVTVVLQKDEPRYFSALALSKDPVLSVQSKAGLSGASGGGGGSGGPASGLCVCTGMQF
jgi:Flp pilus assembly protein TadG